MLGCGGALLASGVDCGAALEAIWLLVSVLLVVEVLGAAAGVLAAVLGFVVCMLLEATSVPLEVL